MMINLSYIRDNYSRILDRMNDACIRTGRKPNDVQLVVVTKHQPVEKILKICETGAENLGENYPEETDKKIADLAGIVKPVWHMIGHIQSRKIKYLVRHFKYVHSIDRFDIAEKLNYACQEAGLVMPVLLEVNLTGEISKFGYNLLNEENVEGFYLEIEKMKLLTHLRLQGFMTMPPITNKPEDNRLVFRRLHSLIKKVSQAFDLQGFAYLSMGTSQDFDIAIEEGATHIRVGEAIMGNRNLNQ